MSRAAGIVGGCLAAILVVIVFAVGIFALGWFGAAVQVVSPDNVRSQYTLAYQDYNSLKQTACNVKDATALVNKTTDPNLQAQYQQQETAYSQNYRRIEAEYDARYANIFAAQKVGPSDLPHTAPDLPTAITTFC